VQLLARRKTKVAAVALANKNARMIWAMMAPVNAIASRRSLKEHGAGHCAGRGWEGQTEANATIRLNRRTGKNPQ
jgi:hypothetical protein